MMLARRQPLHYRSRESEVRRYGTKQLRSLPLTVSPACIAAAASLEEA
jgi:hypothetical protein